MRVEPFVDTNIWVYAHLDDASDPRCERAWELVNNLIRPVISPQVIAEYYKLPTAKLLKSIRSLERQIAQHQQWIDDPYSKIPVDTLIDEANYYVTTKWPGDIARQRQQIDIIRGVLHERNADET